MNIKQQLGKYGEDITVKYYRANGFKLIARNFYCPAGEIDIVCSKKNTFYFIEVKTRTSYAFGYPEESITSEKRERIYRCAQHFLTTQENYALKDIVFHVCAIYRGGSKDIIRIYTDL